MSERGSKKVAITRIVMIKNVSKKPAEVKHFNIMSYSGFSAYLNLEFAIESIASP